MKYSEVFDKLWQQYTHESPEVLRIYNLLKQNGEAVIANDHIAFRTFDLSHINVTHLGKFFESMGYVAMGEYEFPIKKLYARHYECKEDPSQPKIFISELKTREFSPYLQEHAQKCADSISKELLYSPELLYSGALWGPLDYEVYQKLLTESEYAAWLYVFGFRANHFTVAVNSLKKYTGLVDINQLLKDNGFSLNSSGGEIKGSESELLEQSSTIANKVIVKFIQGDFPVLNSYYEFAKRYPMENGKLYQGFIANSADKIFESTNIK